MTAWQLKDWRSLVLATALLLVAVTLILPRVTMQRTVYNLMAFVDITGSMKVRDMGRLDAPVERLEAAKSALRTLLGSLPCQSRLGLGIFTERRSFVLFNPIEVCGNYDPIAQSIAGIDWRMGWEGDSFIAKGLHHAIAESALLNADIVFMTEGQEAPPLPPGSGLPALEGELGKSKGLIVGVGGVEKVPIPRFDSEGHETGAYAEQDVVQENRTGAPPPDAESRAGYHPKWAPFGSDPPTGDEHLSSLRSDHLTALAAQTGLGYSALKDTSNLLPAVEMHATPRSAPVAVDVRPLPGALALLLLTILYAAPLVARGFTRHISSRTGRTT